MKSYVRPFHAGRKANFFLEERNDEDLRKTLQADLRPFLPSQVYEEMERSGFAKIFRATEEILQPLIQDGLDELIKTHGK